MSNTIADAIRELNTAAATVRAFASQARQRRAELGRCRRNVLAAQEAYDAYRRRYAGMPVPRPDYGPRLARDIRTAQEAVERATGASNAAQRFLQSAQSGFQSQTLHLQRLYLVQRLPLPGELQAFIQEIMGTEG